MGVEIDQTLDARDEIDVYRVRGVLKSKIQTNLVNRRNRQVKFVCYWPGLLQQVMYDD